MEFASRVPIRHTPGASLRPQCSLASSRSCTTRVVIPLVQRHLLPLLGLVKRLIASINGWHDVNQHCLKVADDPGWLDLLFERHAFQNLKTSLVSSRKYLVEAEPGEAIPFVFVLIFVVLPQSAPDGVGQGETDVVGAPVVVHHVDSMLVSKVGHLEFWRGLAETPQQLKTCPRARPRPPHDLIGAPEQAVRTN